MCSPHSDVLLNLFGLDAAALATEFDKILTRLTHGLMDIATDMKELHAKSMERLDELAAKHEDLEFEALMAKVFEDPDLPRGATGLRARWSAWTYSMSKKIRRFQRHCWMR